MLEWSVCLLINFLNQLKLLENKFGHQIPVGVKYFNINWSYPNRMIEHFPVINITSIVITTNYINL